MKQTYYINWLLASKNSKILFYIAVFLPW